MVNYPTDIRCADCRTYLNPENLAEIVVIFKGERLIRRWEQVTTSNILLFIRNIVFITN